MLAIVGHKGFIGSYVKRYLKKRDIRFLCFNGDLLNRPDVEKFFSIHKVKEAIFLAGTFGYNFERQLEKNILTLQVFLEIGVKHGLQKIVYLSSGAVYGEPLRNQSYETDPLYPNTLYGISKLYAEECIKYYARNYDIKFVILRLPNVYGKNNYKGVIFNFLSDIKKYNKIIIAGNGSQERNFLHVKDVCVAIEKALRYKKSDIFNISNPKAISVNEIVEELKKRYTFSIAHRPPDNNLKKLLLNIDKAKKLLKFKPSFVELDI